MPVSAVSRSESGMLTSSLQIVTQSELCHNLDGRYKGLPSR
jgi:hypothetical protein